MVIMVNHEFRHPAVYADILASDKPGLVGTEKQDHIRNIHRIPHTAGWLFRNSSNSRIFGIIAMLCFARLLPRIW